MNPRCRVFYSSKRGDICDESGRQTAARRVGGEGEQLGARLSNHQKINKASVTVPAGVADCLVKAQLTCVVVASPLASPHPFLFALDQSVVGSPPSMPSLFSRSRTTSSPLKSQKQSTEASDEFGRVSSRTSAKGGPATIPAKKDKNVEKARTRTLSAAKGRAPGPILAEEEPIIPDGSFFPLGLDSPGGDHLAIPSGSEHGPFYLSPSTSFLSAVTCGFRTCLPV